MFSRLQKAVKTVSCLKCGKETKDSNVFCGACLDEMKEYPIAAGTAVLLPQHPEDGPERKKVRRQQTAKEELSRLRRMNRNLAGLALLMTLAAAAMCLLWLLT